MSFEIEPGTIVGVVGHSGSGKSAISKLIQRLYLPEGGKISIDGMDISLVNHAISGNTPDERGWKDTGACKIKRKGAARWSQRAKYSNHIDNRM